MGYKCWHFFSPCQRVSRHHHHPTTDGTLQFWSLAKQSLLKRPQSDSDVCLKNIHKIKKIKTLPQNTSTLETTQLQPVYQTRYTSQTRSTQNMHFYFSVSRLLLVPFLQCPVQRSVTGQTKDTPARDLLEEQGNVWNLTFFFLS